MAQQKFSERLLIVQEDVAVQLFLRYGCKDITGSLLSVSLLSVSASEHKNTRHCTDSAEENAEIRIECMS